MLTKEENELLCLTALGTTMGTLMRRYWIPAMLSSELPEADGAPVRITLLNESLVAFRDTSGQVGLIGANCPHRGASLFFGRNEECGIRCVYHGWKFDTTGQCMDMPSEPTESNFKAKIKATAYPCEERGGVIWTYMGPPEFQPSGLPDLEWATVSSDRSFASKRLQECNWAQAMEGGIDSSHISFLHGGQPPLKKSRPPGDPNQISDNALMSAGYEYRRRDTSPRFEVVDTEYGLLIGARRMADEETYYWRITQFLMPWYTMIPPFGDSGIGGHAWVPIDDEHCWAWSFSWHPMRPHTPEQLESMQSGTGIHAAPIPGTFRPVRNVDNDYLIDREAQKYASFTGIQGIAAQDCAVQESMGPIYDRRREHLGSSDTAIVAARRRLLKAARELEQGIEPPGNDPESYRVRSYSVLLPKDVPFDQGAKEGLVADPEKFLVSA